MKSDSVFLTKVVLRLHFKWSIAEKPGLHFAVEGVEVSIKSSKMRRSHEVFREYILWAYSFLPYWPCTHSRPLGNDACLLLLYEIIITEMLNK